MQKDKIKAKKSKNEHEIGKIAKAEAKGRGSLIKSNLEPKKSSREKPALDNEAQKAQNNT